MPKRPQRPCRKCKKLHRNKTGYCDEHEELSNWKNWKHAKLTTTERGYGHAWEKIKKRILRRDKALCQPCKRVGRLTQADDVDHIIAKHKGGSDRDDNLECICKPCHRLKTATERY